MKNIKKTYIESEIDKCLEKYEYENIYLVMVIVVINKI